jgi:hypothetical protein
MARTLPSDLFVPEVALETFQVKFVTSLEAMSLMGMGADAPILLRGFGDLVGGGQFIQAPLISRIANLDTARDVTSESDATTLKLGSRNDRGVLINRKVGPVSLTKTAEQLAKVTPEGVSANIGEQMAQSCLETIQQYVIAALFGSVSAVSASAHTKSVWSATVRTNLTTALLAQTKALLGDSAKRLAGWIMRSEPFNTDLTVYQLGQGVTGIADRVSAGGPPHTLGLPFALVDDSYLTAADSGFDKYYTLGLCPGAIEVEFTRPLHMYTPMENTKAENVETVFRADYDFAIRTPGFAFSASYANPSLATIATSGRWTYNAADHREVGIVMAEHNYSGN